MTEWKVIPSPTNPEMFAVQGGYLVADNLPIEDAVLISSANEMRTALKSCLNYIENTESDWCISLHCGELARSALSKATYSPEREAEAKAQQG